MNDNDYIAWDRSCNNQLYLGQQKIYSKAATNLISNSYCISVWAPTDVDILSLCTYDFNTLAACYNKIVSLAADNSLW